MNQKLLADKFYNAHNSLVIAGHALWELLLVLTLITLSLGERGCRWLIWQSEDSSAKTREMMR